MHGIEPATSADVPQLADLLAELFAQEADFAVDREKQVRALRLILDRPDVGMIFVARDGDEIAGMVSLLFTISTACGGPACWLEDMVVRTDRRGTGLGSRLIEHAIGYARRLEVARISLVADRLNEGAIRFYTRHGFGPSAMTAMRLAL